MDDPAAVPTHAEISEAVGDQMVMGPLPIADAAAVCGVSAHTLRYYEREGLLDVPRNGAGRRVFDAEALRRAIFLTRMRISGMPIATLARLAGLIDAGPETIPERRELLAAHRNTLRRQIAELQLCLAVTEYKIATDQIEATDTPRSPR